MAKIVESLRRLSVENEETAPPRRSDKCFRASKCKGEFVASVDEQVVNDDQTYVLGICGTQR